MAYYVWTQKAVDDYAIRHPHQKLCNIPRKVGEVATYDGKPLLCGEVLKAYMARGLVEKQSARKKVAATAYNPRKLPPAPKFLIGDDTIPKKRPLVIWRDLHEFCAKGCSITETSLKYNMPISEIEAFVKANRKTFEAEFGTIDFSKKRLRKAG